MADIPTRIDPQDSITGLIVNPVRSLEKKETDLLRQTYPDIDFARTLILEEDRKPSSLLAAHLMKFSGRALMLLAAIGFVRRLFIKAASWVQSQRG